MGITFQQLTGEGYTGNSEPLKKLYEKNAKHIEELFGLFGRNAVVPMFGAGFTARAYPTWNKLLREMAVPYPNCRKEVGECLDSGAYEKAASALCREMGEDDFLEELKDRFGPHTLPRAMSELTEERKSIAQIFKGPMMTTNVDQVIERLYNDRLPVLCPHAKDQQPEADRALQAADPVLFKLHGDVMKRNPVFTEEAYNRVYVEDNPVLVQTLTRIFEGKTVLFLGCSLEADRVLDVLKDCRKNHVYYALVGLPEETKNEADPCAPLLTGDDGMEHPEYRRRRMLLAGKNIRCIWYPAGHHEAMDLLLAELRKKFAPAVKKASNVPPTQRKILFRDGFRDEILNYCKTDRRPVMVTGTGGMGKTEVCKMALRKMEEAGRSVLYVDVTNVTEPTELGHAIAKKCDASPWPDDQAVNLPAYLEYIKGKILAAPQPALYLDNWESIWDALADKEDTRILLLDWLERLCQEEAVVLLSSRDVMTEYDIRFTVRPLPVLNRAAGEDRALFRQVYEEKNGRRRLEGEAFEELLRQLDGHPLSIVLTASYAAGISSWERVLESWTSAFLKMRNERHRRLDAALQISWDSVAENPDCIMVWGLTALCQEDMNDDWLKKLSENEAEYNRWEIAIRQLLDASLADWSEDGTSLHMLNPVKEGFFLLAGEADALPCFGRWYNYFMPILKQANDFQSPGQENAHIQVMENLSQIFYLLDRMLDKPWQHIHPNAIGALTQRLYNYFQYSVVQGLALCKKIVTMAAEKDDWKLLVVALSRIQGDMLSCLNRMEEAEQQYEASEKLAREIEDNLGRANTLFSWGKLLSQSRGYEKAESKCEEAERLYREIKDNLGLANTLRLRGDVLLKMREPEKAEKQYDEAEEIYRLKNRKLGLANTLKSRGYLQLDRKDLAGAITYFRGALVLYETLQTPWGIAVSSARLSVLLEENHEEAKVFAAQAVDAASKLSRPEREAIYSILSESKELQPT